MKKYSLFLLLVLLLLYSSFHYIKTGIVFSFTRNPVAGDFATSWPTKWAWTLNPDLIQQNSKVLRVTDPQKENWLYGPVMHYVLFPLLFLKSFNVASDVWLFFCHLFFLLSLLLWYKILILDQKLHSFPVLILYLALWFNFFPAYEGLNSRVIEVMELFFLSLCFYAFYRGREALSGFFLGLAIMTKFLPIIFIPYFFIKRKFKIVGMSLVVVSLIAIFAEYNLGWKNNFTLNRVKKIGYAEKSVLSQSIPSFIYRTLIMVKLEKNFLFRTIEESESQKIKQQSRVIIKMAILGVLFFYGIFFILRVNHPISYFDISLLFILMVALLQHNHPYYLMFLLIPFSKIFQFLVQQYQKGSLFYLDGIIFIASYLLLAIFFPVSAFTVLFGRWNYFTEEIYLSYSIPVWGYSLLLVWLTVRSFQSTYANSFFLKQIRK